MLSWVSKNGAEKAAVEAVKYGGRKLRDHITPEAEPSIIDPRAQQAVDYASKTTDCAVIVSSVLG